MRWDKKIKQHDFLIGPPFRFIYYYDNTAGTSLGDSICQTNTPLQTILPAVFIQDEIRLKEKLKTLIGLRYDYYNQHGRIFTPCLSFKWQPNKLNTIRLSGGNGFRVVNLFTEDHLYPEQESCYKSKSKTRTILEWKLKLHHTILSQERLYRNRRKYLLHLLHQ